MPRHCEMRNDTVSLKRGASSGCSGLVQAVILICAPFLRRLIMKRRCQDLVVRRKHVKHDGGCRDDGRQRASDKLQPLVMQGAESNQRACLTMDREKWEFISTRPHVFDV